MPTKQILSDLIDNTLKYDHNHDYGHIKSGERYYANNKSI